MRSYCLLAHVLVLSAFLVAIGEAASTGPTHELMVDVSRKLTSYEVQLLATTGVPVTSYYASTRGQHTILTVAVAAQVTALPQSLLNMLTLDGSTTIRTTVNTHIELPPVLVETDEATTSWALDRIDQRARTLNGAFTVANDGAGIHLYIVDTGVLTTHDDFEGRVGNAYSVVDGGSFTDCNGHGTHVAGAALSKTWGVAKKALGHSVRVLNCAGSGSLGGLAQALYWVLDHFVAPAVINLSLGYYYNEPSIGDAIAQLQAAGVVVVGAAGNDASSACAHYPSAYAGVIKVASSTSNDERSSFSNYGAAPSCVTLFAPGSSVKSTWNNGGTATLSGTSMATPLVVGACALLLKAHPTWSVSSVTAALTSDCTANALSNVNDSPNCLLYVGTGASTGASTSTSGGSAVTTSSGSGSGGGGGGGNTSSNASTLTAWSVAWCLMGAMLLFALSL